MRSCIHVPSVFRTPLTGKSFNVKSHNIPNITRCGEQAASEQQREVGEREREESVFFNSLILRSFEFCSLILLEFQKASQSDSPCQGKSADWKGGEGGETAKRTARSKNLPSTVEKNPSRPGGDWKYFKLKAFYLWSRYNGGAFSASFAPILIKTARSQ